MELQLDKGSQIKLTTNEAFKDKCFKDVLWIDYKNLVNVIEPGKRIYIDDGLISIVATEVGKSRIKTTPYYVITV